METVQEPVYLKKSFIDEGNSCVRVPLGKNKFDKFDYDDFTLLGKEVESMEKYSHLKFSIKWKTDGNDVLFYFE